MSRSFQTIARPIRTEMSISCRYRLALYEVTTFSVENGNPPYILVLEGNLRSVEGETVLSWRDLVRDCRDFEHWGVEEGA